MERREDRCLRRDTGRVDPDIVAPAIVRTICILIATNPLPVIFVPCELVRGNPIMATSRVNEVFCLGRSTSSSSGIVLYEAMFLTAADALLDDRGKACGFFFSPSDS